MRFMKLFVFFFLTLTLVASSNAASIESRWGSYPTACAKLRLATLIANISSAEIGVAFSVKGYTTAKAAEAMLKKKGSVYTNYSRLLSEWETSTNSLVSRGVVSANSPAIKARRKVIGKMKKVVKLSRTLSAAGQAVTLASLGINLANSAICYARLLVINDSNTAVGCKVALKGLPDKRFRLESRGHGRRSQYTIEAGIATAPGTIFIKGRAAKHNIQYVRCDPNVNKGKSGSPTSKYRSDNPTCSGEYQVLLRRVGTGNHAIATKCFNIQ